MNFPVSTSSQLKPVLRALRQRRQLTQADVGRRIGVNQKRVAKIEAAPGVTSFEQIAQIVSALGGRLVIEAQDDAPVAGPSVATAKRSTARGRTSPTQPTW